MTAWLTGSKLRWLRVCLAALLGSIYSVGEVFPVLHFMYGLSVKILVSVIIISITFGKMSYKRFGTVLSIFYLAAFLFGGAIAGWLFMLQNK